MFDFYSFPRDCWTPTLAEVFQEYGSVCPFVRNLRSQYWLINFFLIFCIKLDSQNVRKKWANPQFWKKSHWVKWSQKIPKMNEKWGFFRVLTTFSSINMYFFLLENGSTNGLLTSKTACLRKIWFLSYVTIRMQASLNYNISQTSWVMKLNFCMWLDIHRRNKFTKAFQLVVVRHVRACPKLCKFLSQLDLKNKLSIGIHRSYKFVQLISSG